VSTGHLPNDLRADVEAIDRLDAVHTVLEVLRHATGLRTSLVARVTEDAWTACAVLDGAGYGLESGIQLELSTTF
jgi:hypothetical protein